DPDAVSEVDDGLLGMEVPSGELELLGDADDLFDARQELEHLVESRGQRQADDADDGALLAVDQVWAEAQLLDAIEYNVQFFFAGIRLHDDDHWGTPRMRVARDAGSCFERYPLWHLP